MRINGKKRIALVGATAAAMLIGGGVAFAYWTSAGAGTGKAQAGTVVPLSVDGSNVPSGLYPGGPNQDIDFDITNTNPGQIYVNQVTIAIAGTNKVGCDATDFVLTQPAATNAQVISGVTSYTGAVTGAAIRMINKGVSQDACKGAQVNLTFSSV